MKANQPPLAPDHDDRLQSLKAAFLIEMAALVILALGAYGLIVTVLALKVMHWHF